MQLVAIGPQAGKTEDHPVTHERFRREAKSAISQASKSAAPYADSATRGNPTEGGSEALVIAVRTRLSPG